MTTHCPPSNLWPNPKGATMTRKFLKSTGSRIAASIVITLVFALIYFYVTLPAINLHNPQFYSFAAICLIVYIVVAMLLLGIDTGKSTITLKDYFTFAKSQCKVVLGGLLLLLAVFILGQIISLTIFRSGSYHELLTLETGDFKADVEQVRFNEIPMLDESSAQRLGNRKLGELSDMVSQFEVSTDYVQINYQGRPVRVASLQYGDFFKWLNNRQAGLPAYIMVDMVTQAVEVVRLSDQQMDGIHYSPSEYFSHDLMRALRFQYPTYMFRFPHLEINDEGQPYWVASRETRTIGLFGGADITGAVLMDAITGECTYYDVADVPSWVDRVYDADLITQQYNYYGTFINGFFNSIIGQRDVTVTTQGYNYIAMNDDVYMYTGITSVSSDNSNIGFLLSNQRTKETTFYSAPGAIEESAKESAQGMVQDLGYTATFPLLLNIAGEPTYFMSLKDGTDLVKMYAMANVSQYNIVVIGSSVAECESKYIAKLREEGFTLSDMVDNQTPLAQTEVKGTIAEIRTAVLDGNTQYFIRLSEGPLFYAITASTDREVVTLNVGDAVTIQAAQDEEGQAQTGSILNAYSVKRG